MLDEFHINILIGPPNSTEQSDECTEKKCSGYDSPHAEGMWHIMKQEKLSAGISFNQPNLVLFYWDAGWMASVWFSVCVINPAKPADRSYLMDAHLLVCRDQTETSANRQWQSAVAFHPGLSRQRLNSHGKRGNQSTRVCACGANVFAIDGGKLYETL